MTVATEAENNTTVVDKENKDVKDMKAALNEETPSDNKQTTEDTKDVEKTEGEKKDDVVVTEDNKSKDNVHKVNFEKDVVYLYQLSRTPLIPSISPHCLKVETWLRLNDVKYEVIIVYSIIALNFIILLFIVECCIEFSSIILLFSYFYPAFLHLLFTLCFRQFSILPI